jgi:cytochrome c-type biogenesis protein CcsB
MQALVIAGGLLYLLSSAGYTTYLFLQKNWLQRYAWYGFMAGFAFNLSAVFGTGVISGQLPVRNLHETLIMACLALSVAYILFYIRFRLRVLGVVVAPIAALILLTATLIPNDQVPGSNIYNSFWLVFHIVAIFSGEAAFALACSLGILYLLQENTIKNKHRGFFFSRLPSLDLLDQAGYACLITGFTFMTVGLAAGFVYAKAVWGRFWTWDPKEVWSGITWLLYAALLHERLMVGWRGRRSAIMAIIGFCVILFTFLGVNFFLEGHHRPFTQG